MSEEKKYILTNDTIMVNGVTLYRIKATKSFGDVKEGELGGYVSSESNLDHEGLCWVHDESIVMHKAHVSGNARVRGKCILVGNAKLSGWALVTNKVYMCDSAQISGHARVMGNARVYGRSKVYGYATVTGNANIYGDSCICGHSVVFGDCLIRGSSMINGNAQVYGRARILDCEIGDGARVHGNAALARIVLCGAAHVEHTNQVFKYELEDGRHMVLYPLETGRYVTVYSDNPKVQHKTRFYKGIDYSGRMFFEVEQQGDGVNG